ncbi:MAG: LuxR C-terminal-related transcriptional regulator [Hyphomicrobiaceae bacterium]
MMENHIEISHKNGTKGNTIVRPSGREQSTGGETNGGSSPLLEYDDLTALTFDDAIVLVHPSRLFRESLSALIGDALHQEIRDFPSLEAAEKAGAPGGDDNEQNGLAIVALAGQERSANAEPSSQLFDWAKKRKLAVIGDTEDASLIVELLRNGIKGYLPTTLSLEVWLHALKFVMSGGVFVPASAMLKSGHQKAEKSDPASTSPSLTAKQLAVVEAIRRGKANKVIAYELNMCESTVKVHVRTIMRKLKATNRTQVAYFAIELLREHRQGLGDA